MVISGLLQKAAQTEHIARLERLLKIHLFAFGFALQRQAYSRANTELIERKRDGRRGISAPFGFVS
ncbi:MAG: hypothetical protein II871_02730 [Clostridia bacterium]|nr:hypothetical protein [Clostridia bacterium]